MDRRVQLPNFPLPGPVYDQRQQADLINALNRLVVALRSPGEGRQTTVVLTNLRTTDEGLEVGTLFQVGGELRVVVPNKPHVAGLQASGVVGTVAVTT